MTFTLDAAQQPGLNLKHIIPLPGVKGRFDHFAIDVKGQRLFVAALGNNTLEIVDIANARRLPSITGLRKPTGVLYLTEANQIVVANGDDGTLRVYNGQDYRLVTTVKSLEEADNIRFDVNANRLYVGYGDGALAVIDPTIWKTVTSIKLAAHPESFQLEREGKRIFVNLPDTKRIGVVDRESAKLTAEWPMDKFQANFPMALDEANHRLFSGCRQPARLGVLDTTTGNLSADLAISGDTDDLFYDAKLKRIYISCGEGFVDVISQRSPDNYVREERIATRKGARTSFFCHDLRQFYLAAPAQGSQPAEIRIFEVTK